MAIRDLLSASAGFRRNQWTGRNPNSSPLYNQFSPQRRQGPPTGASKRASELGWGGYDPQISNYENNRAAFEWIRQNHPSALQRGMQAVGRGARSFAGKQLGGRLDVSVDPMPTSQTQTPLPTTSLQPPTNVSVGTGTVLAPGGPSNIMPRINLMGQPVGTGTVLGRDDRPTEQPVQPTETQQTVTGTSPNMGMEQFRRRMGAAGFDLNTPVPKRMLTQAERERGAFASSGSGVPADVRKKIFRDEMDQRIRGMDIQAPSGDVEPLDLLPEAEAPLSFWQKAGSFFKKPEVSRGMIAMGGSMLASDSPYFGQSVGEGLRAGQEAAGLAREEEERLRQEGRLDTQLAQQTELYERQITAEDLSIKREEERREAYDNIFADGVFNDEGFSSAMEIALKHGDTGFATALIQMRPKDDVKDYQITTKYNSEKGFNEDHLLLIDPKTGEFETKLIGRSKLAAGAGVSGSGDSYDNLWQPGIMGGFEMVRGERPYMMAGFELIDPDDPSKGHKRVGWFDPDRWRSILGNAIARGAGGEDMGWLEAMATDNIKEWITKSEWGKEIQSAYTGALQAINPIVRYLSGAQMTNKEAMRYYGSLIPGFGDSEEQVRIKVRGLEMMLNAMASGNEEAQRMMASAGFTRYHGGSSVPWTMMSDEQQEREGARIQDSIQRVYDQARMEIEREDRAAGITPRGEETDEDYYRRIRGGA